MSTSVHGGLIIAVAAGVTMLIRFAPFLIFGGKRQVPVVLHDLGDMLPCAVMAMLVVYCLRHVTPWQGSHGLPELISMVFVSGSYVWKRNTLLSIAAGTALYMVLVQLVF